MPSVARLLSVLLTLVACGEAPPQLAIDGEREAPRLASARAPRIVELDPPDGALDVEPGARLLRVVFDRPMAEGWSWVTEGEESFPKRLGRASQSEDRREAYLPVELEAGRAYVVWLNSDQHLDFADPAGTPLPPFRWTFATRAAP